MINTEDLVYGKRYLFGDEELWLVCGRCVSRSESVNEIICLLGNKHDFNWLNNWLMLGKDFDELLKGEHVQYCIDAGEEALAVRMKNNLRHFKALENSYHWRSQINGDKITITDESIKFSSERKNFVDIITALGYKEKHRYCETGEINYQLNNIRIVTIEGKYKMVGSTHGIKDGYYELNSIYFSYDNFKPLSVAVTEMEYIIKRSK